MKRLKFILVTAALMVAMIMPSFSFAAVDSPVAFNPSTVLVQSQTTKVYNGNGTSFYAWIIGEDGKAEQKIVTVEGSDAGTYTVGKLADGTEVAINFTITKATGNKITTAVSSKTYKASSLKKRAYSFSLKAKAKYAGTTTYKSSSKYVTVSKTGKVTVKKGAKKGKYKIAVTVKTTNYKTVVKYIYVTVK